ncbi:HD domain-containing protein [Amycolatopsis sp. NPDC001319]|uniref:HD domain-containing protein n=1 Tax=unclassified Amycolatopsis TaxID=2618356 RepID=UPI0036AFB9B3
MASDALHRALTEPGDPPVRALPPEAARLLTSLAAPGRLAAHLRAVHDVASDLTAWLLRSYPVVGFDRAAVLFGAATHDIGKIAHPRELSEPGSDHEEAGYHLLLAENIDQRLARFARTHGSWDRPGNELDDLLVSLADKVWKAKRVPDLEQLVVDRLAEATGEQPWQTFLKLDEQLEHLAAGADHRLDFQNQYPVAA